MTKIVLESSEAGYWPIDMIADQSHFILIHFLITDVRYHASEWIEWLNNPERQGASANATVVTMDPDCPEDIWLSDVLDDGDLEDIPHFIIKKNNLIELLQKWDKLYKQEVPYIVIIIGDHHVHIEGKASIG
jgi:hypothetical protein